MILHLVRLSTMAAGGLLMVVALVIFARPRPIIEPERHAAPAAPSAPVAPSASAASPAPAAPSAPPGLVGVWHSTSGPGMWEWDIRPGQVVRRVGPQGIEYSSAPARLEPGRIMAGEEEYTWRWDGADLVVTSPAEGHTWTLRRAPRSRAR